MICKTTLFVIANVIIETKVYFRIVNICTGTGGKVEIQVTLTLQLASDYLTDLLPMLELTPKNIKLVFVGERATPIK